MLENNILPGITIIVGGILVISIRFLRWGWFMNHWKVRQIDDTFGMKWGDVIYYISGLGFIALGIIKIMGVI